MSSLMRQICGNAIEMSEKKGENAKREKGTIIEYIYIYNEIINRKCKKILNFIK